MIALARDADRTWMTNAACHGHDPEMFFPTTGLPTAEVKAICNACPVKDRCDAYADAHHERHGVWGGRQRHWPRNRPERRKEGAK